MDLRFLLTISTSQLSDKGKRHAEIVKNYRALAAQEIFNANNPRYHERRPTRCDLHGLHIKEAKEYTREHLIRCRTSGLDKTMIVVGRGSHSEGAAILKPAIFKMLNDMRDVVAAPHEKNEGCIVVELPSDGEERRIEQEDPAGSSHQTVEDKNEETHT